ETGVEQVEDGVLNAPHVLVHRQPVVGGGLVEHAVGKVGTGEAGVVPGGLHEGVEGVGLPLQGLAVQFVPAPCRVRLDGGVDAVHVHVLGQQHRQLVGGDGNLGTVAAVEHGDGGAPVALARDAPVAEAEVGGDPALALGDQGV